MQNELSALAAELTTALASSGQTVTTAESCTGGWIAKLITDIPGSSAIFESGLVTYSNAAKQSLLGVGHDVLESHGAVSDPVVRAMADGARTRAAADIAVAVSGIAGPDGGTPDKPVGTVWFAWSTASTTEADCQQFSGDRNAVRAAAARYAMRGVLNRIGRSQASGSSSNE